MTKRILITGGSGFVGTNLVEHFLTQDWEVLNFDIAEPRNSRHFLYWKKVDILDRHLLLHETIAFKPSVFLHFAARTDLDEHNNPGGYAANIEGVCNVIEAVRSVSTIQRVIIASSQLVCKLGYEPKNDYDYAPSTLYGQSKVLSERIVRAANDIGAAWSIVRPTSLWGPWFGVPYKNFFETIARNQYIHPGSIKTLKQWGFVGNSAYQVDRLVHASADLVDKKTFYMADYQPFELRNFADQVQKAIGARPIPAIPAGVMKTIAFGGDILQKIGWKNPPLTSFRLSNILTNEVQDLEPLREVVGPLPYTIPQGITLTVQWLNQQKSI
jgi:nucleoside-diphosphate-sugar epimerase